MKKSFIKSVLYSTAQQMPIYLRNQCADLEYNVQCTHNTNTLHITEWLNGISAVKGLSQKGYDLLNPLNIKN